MTIALARTATSQTSNFNQTNRLAQVNTQQVTITLTVNLPAEASANAATQIADQLRTHAQQLAGLRGGTTQVSVASNPNNTIQGFRQVAGQNTNAIPPRRGGLQPVPLRPRRSGTISPNSPAHRDAQAARLRLLQATAVSAVSAVSPASPSQPAETGLNNLVIDLIGRRVRIDGHDVNFTHKEFELLAHLSRQARQVVSREELMGSVWSDASGDTKERTVDVHVRRVRNKLGRYRKLISTVRGGGYRLDPGSDVTVLGR